MVCEPVRTPPGTAPYRMAYSCSTTNVRRYHVDTAVPQLIADFFSGLLIEVPVELVAMATVDGRVMMGDLLIAFARIGRPQFVEAFEVVLYGGCPVRGERFPVGNRGSFRSVQAGCGYRRARLDGRISVRRGCDHPP